MGAPGWRGRPHELPFALITPKDAKDDNMHSLPCSRETIQKGLLWVAIIALANSLWMVWAFGYAMSVRHAIALVAVDIVGALAFVLRGFMLSEGAKGAGHLAAAAGVGAIAIAFFSHLGYTIGMRSESISQSTMQAAAYTMRTDAVTENKDLLAVMKKRLVDLTEQNGWSASVTAEALRAQIAASELDIEQEKARGGCKSKCLKKVKALGDLQGQIAILETRDGLVKEIAATQKVIATASEATIATEVKGSPVKAQTEFLGQIWNAAMGEDAETILNPSAVQMSLTSILVGVLISLASTASPPILFWLAFWAPTGDKKIHAPAHQAKPGTPPARSWNLAGVNVGTMPTMPGLAIMPASDAARGVYRAA
jgi:hypothetical protein